MAINMNRKLLKLLADRHADDVFVSECKDGPTHFGSHLRMDAWVMNRSWANMCFIGYEIKTSRSDFMGDQKWPNYLKYCNKFFFVTHDEKVISKEDLPDGIGLLVMTKTGSKLITKKHPHLRSIDTPTSVLQYVLMCRATVGSYDYLDRGNVNQWRRWLEEREEDRKIGYNVSKTLRKKYDTDVVEQKKANERLQQENERLTIFKDALEKCGIPISYWDDVDRIADKLKEATRVFTSDRIQTLKYARDNLDRILEDVKKLHGEEQHARPT